MKIFDKKKYLIDLLNDCKTNLFNNPELYYYRLRMIEFIEQIDFNTNIILYHQNKFIFALRMKYFTSHGWRNKRYYTITKNNDLRKMKLKKGIQLTINF